LVVIGFLAGEVFSQPSFYTFKLILNYTLYLFGIKQVAGTSAIFPVHLLAPKSNCQKGNAPENDFSSSVDASRFGLHGSPTFWQIGPLYRPIDQYTSYVGDESFEI
jgi:hypothetical protein